MDNDEQSEPIEAIFIVAFVADDEGVTLDAQGDQDELADPETRQAIVAGLRAAATQLEEDFGNGSPH